MSFDPICRCSTCEGARRQQPYGEPSPDLPYGFIECIECLRRWHLDAQKEHFVGVKGPDGHEIYFCIDDLNCAAVCATAGPEKYFKAAMKARELRDQKHRWRK
jgi:hypothetical protein